MANLNVFGFVFSTYHRNKSECVPTSCKFQDIFHISNAAFSSSMLEYFGVAGSDIILLSSSMASIVVWFGS